MRIRSTERPPTRADIDRILQNGATADDCQRFRRFLRRLEKASFLDAKCRPLSARERLVEQYKQDGLVLFLGAGVSRDSGIPAWPELAERLLLKSGVTCDELGIVKRVFPSPIIEFELAAQLQGADRDLVIAIYNGLYERMDCKLQLERIPRKYEEQIGWDGWGCVFKALQANKTLQTIGDLLIRYDGSEPKRNPQIHAVITVNADNLLELYCEAKTSGRRVVTMVDRASVGEHPNQIPVYHLHGTLDARGENLFRSPPTSLPTGELQELTDELLPDLVFRESEYYETIANPASFVNHTPQSFLRGLNALFIGTSLDDLNMRRWLHDSFYERVRHRTNYLREFYAIRYAEAEYEAKIESRRHFWVRPETEQDKDGKPVKVPKKYADCVMNNLGIHVVWCTDYEDMRRCIAEVQQRGLEPGFGRQVADFPS
jgi:hypothetical protein